MWPYRIGKELLRDVAKCKDRLSNRILMLSLDTDWSRGAEIGQYCSALSEIGFLPVHCA
jgi:hypothetical protein